MSGASESDIKQPISFDTLAQRYCRTWNPASLALNQMAILALHPDKLARCVLVFSRVFPQLIPIFKQDTSSPRRLSRSLSCIRGKCARWKREPNCITFFATHQLKCFRATNTLVRQEMRGTLHTIYTQNVIKTPNDQHPKRNAAAATQSQLIAQRWQITLNSNNNTQRISPDDDDDATKKLRIRSSILHF